MEQWRKNVYILWLAVFLSAICWTMVMPFMPEYLVELGVVEGAELWSGIIIAASALCSVIMSPFWGAMGDRYGRRMMMLRAGTFLAIGYACMAVVRGPYDLLLVRMLIGGFTGFMPMAIALVGVSTPQEHVGKALGMVQTAWPSGAIIGPVVGGLMADWVGIEGSAWVSAVMISMITGMVMLKVKEEFAPPKTERSSLLQDLRIATGNRALMAIVLITTASQGAIMALEPVLVPFVKLVEGPDAPGWMSGLLFSIPGLAFIFMAPYWARRGERMGFATTVGLGLIGSCVLYVAQAFVTGPWQLGALRLLSGVTGAAIGPGVAALLATAVPRDLRGRAFGLNQSASSVGSMLGPLLGGYLGSMVGPRSVFMLAGLLYGAGYLWVRYAVQPRVQAAKPAAQPSAVVS